MISSRTKASVFVVDHDSVERERIVSMCHLMGFPAFAYETAEEFLAGPCHDQQGCVISELRLRGMNGASLLNAMIQQQRSIPFILLTAHPDIPLLVDVLKQGAFAILEKPYRPQLLWDQIVRAIESNRKLRERDAFRASLINRINGLTAEEQQILEMIIADMSNKQIASRMQICLRTVDHRRAEILRKLGMRNLKALIWHVGRAGWPAELDAIEHFAQGREWV